MDTAIKSLSNHRWKVMIPFAAGLLVLALLASGLLWGGTASAQLAAGTTISGALEAVSTTNGTVTVEGEGDVDVSGAAVILIEGEAATLAELEAFLAAQMAAGIEVSVTIIVTAEGEIIVIVGENPGEDFITGGGWIIGPHGAKANFGLVAGPHRGQDGRQFRGSVNYVDHGAAAGEVRHVKSTAITGYFGACPSTIRHISGEAKVNGQAGYTFLAHAEDNGEPGRNDRFGIRVFNSSGVMIYSAFGTLGNGGPGGGNIKLHPPCDKQ